MNRIRGNGHWIAYAAAWVQALALLSVLWLLAYPRGASAEVMVEQFEWLGTFGTQSSVAGRNTGAEALGINSSGDITGEILFPQMSPFGTITTHRQAFAYLNDTFYLGPDDFNGSSGRAINDSGTVAGEVRKFPTADQIGGGFRWQPGNSAIIVAPGGSGEDINNAGVIAGHYLNEDFNRVPFRAPFDIPIDIDVPNTGAAFAVNEHGHVAGRYINDVGNGFSIAFIDRNGQTQFLGSLGTTDDGGMRAPVRLITSYSRRGGSLPWAHWPHRFSPETIARKRRGSHDGYVVCFVDAC